MNRQNCRSCASEIIAVAKAYLIRKVEGDIYPHLSRYFARLFSFSMAVPIFSWIAWVSALFPASPAASIGLK